MQNESAICIGTLDDDPTALAGRVKQALDDDGYRTVWADVEGRVYLDDPTRIGRIDPACMVGTFGSTQPLRDIEGDLRALQSERSTDSIVDPPSSVEIPEVGNSGLDGEPEIAV